MRVRIDKGIANGVIQAPASKSMAHRLLISAGLSEGKSIIRGISKCQDVLATIDCLEALGVKTEINGSDIIVYGINMRKAKPNMRLECRESGSTLRFMLPIAMLSGNASVLHGAEDLMKRPMSIYEELFSDSYHKEAETITVKGPLKSGEYTILGNVSSQFVSGLIFALPLLDNDSIIKITPPIESRSYINLTISAVKKFGIVVDWLDDNTLSIKGNQTYKACDVSIEGDYSGAAFFDALNFLGGSVLVQGLDADSIQGDKIYKKLFNQLSKESVTININDCPDLAPILFCVAAAKHGGTFCGTKRLKIKESDRAETMAEELRKFGTTVTVNDDSVVVAPADFHAPNVAICGHNDHRVVMSLAVLLTLTSGEIDGAEAISKSYPDFFGDLRRLGIGVEEI